MPRTHGCKHRLYPCPSSRRRASRETCAPLAHPCEVVPRGCDLSRNHSGGRGYNRERRIAEKNQSLCSFRSPGLPRSLCPHDSRIGTARSGKMISKIETLAAFSCSSGFFGRLTMTSGWQPYPSGHVAKSNRQPADAHSAGQQNEPVESGFDLSRNDSIFVGTSCAQNPSVCTLSARKVRPYTDHSVLFCTVKVVCTHEAARMPRYLRRRTISRTHCGFAGEQSMKHPGYRRGLRSVSFTQPARSFSPFMVVRNCGDLVRVHGRKPRPGRTCAGRLAF